MDYKHKMKYLPVFFMMVLFSLPANAFCQLKSNRKTKDEFSSRTLRYQPDGTDFVIENGNRRYNRALYGTHTAFRVEAGDLPEFALFMPGIGGDFKLGIISGNKSKWCNDFSYIQSRYRPGSMIYHLKDEILGKAKIDLQLLAMNDAEGMLLRVIVAGAVPELKLVWAFGGASGLHPSRNGDIGADPESVFYLTPEHCMNNIFTINHESFDLEFPDKNKTISLQGATPVNSKLQIADANYQQSPALLLQSSFNKKAPVLAGQKNLKTNDTLYFAIRRKDSSSDFSVSQLSDAFAAAEKYREQLAERIKIQTPDSFLNTLGGTISVAADALWESPEFMHGAVAWRMPLNGWRGQYAADDLGWHDRAKTYFKAYNKSQLTYPDSTIVDPDSSKNLARQVEKIGVGIYNSGYVSRYPDGKIVPNHYDMNLVYFDAMLRHFLWTGDTVFLRECWPAIKRQLAWEKRNFDHDNDGLYDAYACIWASDALEYSGGDVTHSSSYNYFANKIAAQIAQILGDDPTPYFAEASKTDSAINKILWMPANGWYAEYKDANGEKKLHPDAALWSIYHAIDSRVPDIFQSYESLRYIDTHIPHISIKCSGLKGNYFMLSTTDWMPYTWSLNNVVMAEMAHTSLAYWQGERRNTAFDIFKSMIIESMYLSVSPGNFEQLSYYDRYRGELYRDFGDPIGITSRALVEGLFGIRPDALSGTLLLQPGWPSKWKYASITIPDIKVDYHQNGNEDDYVIIPAFKTNMNLQCRIPARGKLEKVSVNGANIFWHSTTSIGEPFIEFTFPFSTEYHIQIKWSGGRIASAQFDSIAVSKQTFKVKIDSAKIVAVNDPQQTLSGIEINEHQLSGKVTGTEREHTLFVKVEQNNLTWWIPINFSIRAAFQIIADKTQDSTGIRFFIQNNTTKTFSQTIFIQTANFSQQNNIVIAPHKSSSSLYIPSKDLLPGTNKISISSRNEMVISKEIINWNLPFPNNKFHSIPVNISVDFNDKVTQIFLNKYLSPRPDVPTLQLPEQGIGNWCYPLIQPEINDSGLRKLASSKGTFLLPDGIPFATPSANNSSNIVFTSHWDNYPDKINIALSGKAIHAYFLMAGSTNPMQSRITNGKIIIHYTDGTDDSLLLKNPDTWWPIEQDYSCDNYAFQCSTPVPYRVHLQSGLITRNFNHYASIKGFTDLAIPGGAATVLDMPLNKNKFLKSLELETVANDVVIGLMSVTLV
ncbi:MAG TPA: DUF4450 domain-containing protein, partial [Hanamia sp.]|nr:DUF4450 domain-containing protein [Hanamia sp.]